jgi:hypothetical protein
MEKMGSTSYDGLKIILHDEVSMLEKQFKTISGLFLPFMHKTPLMDYLKELEEINLDPNVSSNHEVFDIPEQEELYVDPDDDDHDEPHEHEE